MRCGRSTPAPPWRCYWRKPPARRCSADADETDHPCRTAQPSPPPPPPGPLLPPPPPLSSPVGEGAGAGAAAVVTVVAAVGTPVAQDTAMVTVLAAVVNTTRAVVAGPRATLLAVKPCCGLHDSRKAPAEAQWATTVPPDELKTVPLVLAVPPDPPALAPLLPLVPPALRWDCGVGEEGAAAWLAC